MDSGSLTKIMGMSGSRIYCLSGPIIAMAIGFTQTMDGPGFPDTAGGGLPSTTVVGYIVTGMDGCGFQDISGRLPGLPGEAAETITGGLPWDPVSI